MPVIINDFEIIPEQPSGNGSPDSGQSETQPSTPQISPEDIEMLLAYLAGRCARLTAD
jgi:hypothetical protein